MEDAYSSTGVSRLRTPRGELTLAWCSAYLLSSSPVDRLLGSANFVAKLESIRVKPTHEVATQEV